MAEYIEVVNAGPGWTEVKTADGEVLRVEGNRNWRNNNPGNIEYGDFSKSMGAIGTDGRFAVFPTYDAGRAAKENLIFESKNYRDLPLSGAINRYAPPFENNTQSYLNQVVEAAGVSPNTPMSAIPADKRASILDAMQRIEGWKVGAINGVQAPPIMAYNNTGQLPKIGPTGGPALDAINKATGFPVSRPQAQQPGMWSNLISPIKTAMGGLPTQIPAQARQIAANPQVQQAMIGPLMGSLAGRTAIGRHLMNQNIGAAPTVTQGSVGPGTRAIAVNQQGATPVMLTAAQGTQGGTSSPASGAHGGMNMDVYRANRDSIGSPITSTSIASALSSGRDLYRLA